MTSLLQQQQEVDVHPPSPSPRPTDTPSVCPHSDSVTHVVSESSQASALWAWLKDRAPASLARMHVVDITWFTDSMREKRPVAVETRHLIQVCAQPVLRWCHVIIKTPEEGLPTLRSKRGVFTRILVTFPPLPRQRSWWCRGQKVSSGLEWCWM